MVCFLVYKLFVVLLGLKQNTLPLLFNQPYLSQALEETLRALTRTLRKVTLDDWTVCPKRKSYYINVLLEE